MDRTSHGALMSPRFEAIPAELRSVPRWVVWKGEKVPYCATASNSAASVTDPHTWATFNQAQAAYEEGGYAGVGFVLNGDGIVGVDLDKCVSAGEPAPAALSLLDRVGCSYIELSPSGTGLRGFGYGENIPGRRGKLDGVSVEIYASKRYLTVTGRPVLPGKLVPLKGFVEVADLISPAHLQKRTEDDRSNLLSLLPSSVASVGIPPHTLPTQEGERNRCLFELARYVKGKNPAATREELRAIAKQWHALALPVIGTKDFAVTWGDFQHGWARVRNPYGETMQSIIDRIDQTTPLPPLVAGLGYGPQGEHLIRLCIALQAHQGEDPFFLSARQAGEVLGVHFTDASKMLAALVGDNVLALVSKGAGNKASRYRLASGCSDVTPCHAGDAPRGPAAPEVRS